MPRGHAIVRALALSAFVFGLLVWLYVIVVQITHPDWVTTPFSHIHVFPFDWRLDEAGMTAFAIAAVGFFVWQIENDAKSK